MDCVIRRRGSVYVAVLGGTMAVTVIGLSAVVAVRAERRAADITADLGEARFYAQSGIEMGMWIMQNDSNWRGNQTSGSWKANQAIGNGTYSLEGVDPIDGNLANSKSEPVEFTGTGRVHDARFILQATAVAEPVPLEALQSALHAGGDVSITVGKVLTVSGGPVSTNGTLNNLGTIAGDVKAVAIGMGGIITGTTTTLSSPMAMPDSGVFDLYRSLATTIAYSGTINKRVLSPSSNPWGTPNPDGVYYIDTGANDLTISNTRLLGTLVVRCGAGKKVILQSADFFQNYRADYPVLIVDGELAMQLSSTTLPLSEVSNLTNFNPGGSPFQSVSDGDILDTYPNEVRGLVHAKQLLTMDMTTKVVGGIIAEGAANLQGVLTIVYDPALYTDPPMGYNRYEMKLAPGSWQRLVLP